MLIFLSHKGHGAAESDEESAPPEESDASLIATLRSSASSGADLTTYTFSALALGPAAVDRLIAVGVSGRDNEGGPLVVNSVTVGGVNLGNNVQIEGRVGGGNPGTVSGIFWGIVPDGTTGDVVVTFSYGILRAGVAVYEIPGASTMAPDSGGANNAATMSDTMNVAEGGAIIAIGITADVGADTAAWTGVSEDLDAQVGGETANYSAASESQLSAEAGRAVQVVWTGIDDDQSMAIVSFAPA